MSNQVELLDDDTFSESTRQGVWLVDFWSHSCAPCHAQAPIVANVARLAGERAHVAAVNVDLAPRTAQALGVDRVPTLVVLESGHVTRRFVGVHGAKPLLESLHLA